MRRIYLIAAMIAMLSAGPGRANADLISDLYGTGVDAQGNLLAGGATDPHYSYSIDGGATFTSAVVVNVNPATYDWAANSSSSQWISAVANGVPPSPVDYLYQTTFTLPSNAFNATLYFTNLTGDDGVTVYLNGNLVYDYAYTGSNAPWTGLVSPFSYTTFSSFIVGGTNVLTFDTPNSSGPGGLQVEITGLYNTPEPSAMAMAPVGGLAMIGHAVRRRRRA